MKKILSITAILFGIMLAFAQVPEKMSYQAIIRNASGQLLQNQNVAVKASILQGSASGTVVYSERITGTTNANGLLSAEIGTGTVISGTFSTINWSSGNYYLKTETDPNGGTNYTIAGTSQLLSVPYAMYAKNAGVGQIVRNDVLTVTPLEFTSPPNNNQLSGTFLTSFSTNVTGSLLAPVHLPNGANITEIKVYFVDTFNNNDYQLGFSSLPQGIPFPATLASTTTSGADTAVRNFNLTIPTPIVINNANNFYYLAMSGNFKVGDGIAGVKITYNYPVNN